MIVSQQKVLVALIFLAVLLSGCAGQVKNMRPVSEDKVVNAPRDGKSHVVFMRPSGHAFTIQSSVYTIQDEKPSLIGLVAAKKKVSFEATPGKHLFMVIGDNVDFLSADLLPNKTYYVLITAGFGIWKASFSLKPIQFSDLEKDDFNKWLSECEWVEKSPETATWITENIKAAKSKYREYYPKWKSKISSKRLALLPKDGV